MIITDYITQDGAEHHLGRALTPAEIAELTLLGDAVLVEAAVFIRKAWVAAAQSAPGHAPGHFVLKASADAADGDGGDGLVRGHTRHYPPGAHPTLRGDININPYHRRKRK
jgi:hypothetical protein